MEPPLAFAVGIAGISAAMLALETVRRRPAARVAGRWVERFRPFRSLIVAVALSSLWASVRSPATASTPPAPMRLSGLGQAANVVPGVTSAIYEVEPGDCLWRIARGLLFERGGPATGADITRAWRAIYEMNRSVIGSDPDLIHPGQVFEIPEEL